MRADAQRRRRSSTKRCWPASAASADRPGCSPPTRSRRRSRALQRFRALCDTMRRRRRLWVLATAACRDADNGPDFIAAAEHDLPHRDRRALRQARGAIVRARRRLRLPPARRHRRRSRRRLARTGRCARRTHRRRRHAAARRPCAAGPAPESSIKKAEKIVARALRRRQAARRAARAAPSTPSAAPGARSPGCTCGRPAIRCTSCTATSSAPSEALEFSRLVRRVDPETLSQIEVVNEARRPLLAYAALVLEHIMRDRRAEARS